MKIHDSVYAPCVLFSNFHRLAQNDLLRVLQVADVVSTREGMGTIEPQLSGHVETWAKSPDNRESE